MRNVLKTGRNTKTNYMSEYISVHIDYIGSVDRNTYVGAENFSLDALETPETVPRVNVAGKS